MSKREALAKYENLWLRDEESGHGYIDPDHAAHWCERWALEIREGLSPSSHEIMADAVNDFVKNCVKQPQVENVDGIC